MVVPDPDSLYQAFAAGLRKVHGKLLVSSIPRMTRPRKKYGTVRGFSVVDPGGNWLRIYKLGESEEKDSAEKAEGLTQIIYVAARLGDARGDEALALKTLENGWPGLVKLPKPWNLQRHIYTELSWLFEQRTMPRLDHHFLRQSHCHSQMRKNLLLQTNSPM